MLSTQSASACLDYSQGIAGTYVMHRHERKLLSQETRRPTISWKSRKLGIQTAEDQKTSACHVGVTQPVGAVVLVINLICYLRVSLFD